MIAPVPELYWLTILVSTASRLLTQLPLQSSRCDAPTVGRRTFSRLLTSSPTMGNCSAGKGVLRCQLEGTGPAGPHWGNVSCCAIYQWFPNGFGWFGPTLPKR